MPISPESRYCIDGAVALLQISSDIAEGVSLGEIDVDGIIDERDMFEHVDTVLQRVGENTFAAVVTTAVERWFQTAPPFKRALMVFRGLFAAEIPMQELRWGISGVLAENYLYRRYPNAPDMFGVHIERDDSLFPPGLPPIQSLRSPTMVGAVLDRNQLYRPYPAMMRKQYDRAVEAFRDISFECFLQDFRTYQTDRLGERPMHQPPPLQPVTMTVRKAVRRGIRAMNAAIQPNAYQAFISATGLLLKGQIFNYRARKTNSILDHTANPDQPHIPYQLEILSKDHVVLGRGCVIFTRTPVLDQVIALSLHVRDRETEIALLKTANWNYTESGRRDHTFRELTGAPLVDDPIEPEDNANATDFRTHFEGINWRLVARRKNIMRCIDANVDRHLIELSGVPKSFFEFLSNPPAAESMAVTDWPLPLELQ